MASFFILLLSEAFFHAARAIQADRGRAVEFTDTEGDSVEIRLEDGCLNLYGNGELGMTCLKDLQIDVDGRTMDFTSSSGEEATTTVPVGQETIVDDVKAIFKDAGEEEEEQEAEDQASSSNGDAEEHGADSEPNEETSEIRPVTVVEYVDTQGDPVKLEREGDCVTLSSGGEIIETCLQMLSVRSDGRTLDFAFADGEVLAMSTVPVGQEEIVLEVAAVFKDTVAAERLTEAAAEEVATENDPIQQKLLEVATESDPIQQKLLEDIDASTFLRLPRKQSSEMWIYVEGDRSAPGAKPSSTFPDIARSVASLNPVTFQANVLQEHGSTVHWIVLFCYDWWEHCQSIAEPFAELSESWQKELNTAAFEREVRFAKVDCATDRVLCNEQGVTGLPNVQHYSKGARVSRWTGGQKNDAKALEKWITKKFSSEALARSRAGSGKELQSPRMALASLGVEGYVAVVLILMSVMLFAYKLGA
eukprot:TRINITY_DN2167_c0_g1_i1.p1 TRINITY_DN2167_c0_g1~~TRINITY_DN2167_c0_g1_i1.p1  ORF type:complete len:476 (+),score=132.41 TRINITY_DN2167_c0_g1_i1:112-1539(+)